MTVAVGALAALNMQAQNLLNGSFEDGLDNWETSNLAVQGNESFLLKSGNNYLEKWTSRGSTVGSASVSQTVKALPAGIYTLTVSAQNIQEDTPANKQKGAWIFANDLQVEVSETKDYSLSVPLITGQLTVGFKAVDATGNWLALDNFRLECTDTQSEELRAELLKLIKASEQYTDSLMSESSMSALKKAIAEAQAFYDQQTCDGSILFLLLYLSIQDRGSFDGVPPFF